MRVSIVVAAKNASSMIHETLTAWQKQMDPKDEILVPCASNDQTADIIRREFPDVKLYELKPESLVPELWSAGISQSHGELVAISIANCVPHLEWLRNAKMLFRTNYAAAGGAIWNHPDASLIDTAVYLCRYWRYMPPFTAIETADLPGDNAIYRRSDLLKYRDLFELSFWEPEINNRMIIDGLRLQLSPDLIVSHKRSFGFLAFLKNRLQHGYHYGRERSVRMTVLKRLAFILAFPMIPLLLLSRIWKAVLKSSEYKGALIRSLPIIMIFLCAWAAGEAAGYAAGPLHHENRD